MEITPVLSCPCRPGFSYKSPESLIIHKRSKMHKTWVSQQEVKDVRAISKTFENEIERLKNRLKHREAVEAELLSRIRSLTDEVDYWKGYFNERFVQ